MSKKLKIILAVICIVLMMLTVALFLVVKGLQPDIPKPKSDVPITYKIGWWNHQKGLAVQSLTTEKVYSSLNLMNSKAVIQYHIKGNLTHKKGWKPYIKSVFLSERWLKNPENFNGNTAEILIKPIVGIKKDELYNGEVVSFIKVQDYLHSGGWGTNTYIVSAQNKKSVITLQQRK